MQPPLNLPQTWDTSSLRYFQKPTSSRAILLAFMLACAMGSSSAAESPGTFETLGVPVVKAGLMGFITGPGPDAGSERIYFNFRQDGGTLFLVAVDPVTGTAEQFSSPVGTGGWAFMVGPDDRIYLGTHEGPEESDNGQILVFDPRQPEKAIQVVGRPSETETYLWMYTLGADGKIYGCTYPNAKLVSYDPATGELVDHGVMDVSQKYSRSIAAGPDGRIYTGIGYGRANVVMFDPKTGEHKGILPDEFRSDPAQTVATVYEGEDGNVYVQAIKMTVLNGDPENGEIKEATSVTLLVKGDKVEEAAAPSSQKSRARLKDGRTVVSANLNGEYTLALPDGSREDHAFTYKGDGAGIFMVNTGPLGRIYGGAYMPNEIFWFDPETGASENPGNATEVGGEIYSMLEHGDYLYVCAYPGSFLSKWNPAQPWNYGRAVENNPQGFGPLGPGHLRPRAMVHGPGGVIYIGSYPEYGKHGGSLGVWNPVTDKLVANYHNLIENQSIITLVHDGDTGLVFGGSSTAGGGGTDPIEPAARFFAFDAAEKKLVLEESPWPDVQEINNMVKVGRRIYGMGGQNHLFVYDIDEKTFVEERELPLGPVLDCSLGLWKDGMLYGLTESAVFRLDPASLTAEILATFDGSIHCGFAMDDKGIYFGHKATLMRYNWPAGE